jgi:hypothetical protein
MSLIETLKNGIKMESSNQGCFWEMIKGSERNLTNKNQWINTSFSESQEAGLQTRLRNNQSSFNQMITDDLR